MYRTGSFLGLDSIGVLCRGRSVKYLGKANDLFEHCFLVGQFENALKKIGKHIIGKQIVQIVNKSTIKVNKKVCEKYSIQDIQCNFDGWKDKEMSQPKKALYRKIVKTNPWAKVSAAPLGIKDRMSGIKWATTGLFAVDLACFFRPSRIIIIGLDFYEAQYFSKEKVASSFKKNRKRGEEMRRFFQGMVRRDKSIEFEIYTCSSKIKSHDNLKVTRF